MIWQCRKGHVTGPANASGRTWCRGCDEYCTVEAVQTHCQTCGWYGTEHAPECPEVGLPFVGVRVAGKFTSNKRRKTVPTASELAAQVSPIIKRLLDGLGFDTEIPDPAQEEVITNCLVDCWILGYLAGLTKQSNG